MKRKLYEKPILPTGGISPQLGAQPMVAQCPGCGLKMVLKVVPVTLTWNIQISSEPEDIQQAIKATRGKSFGS